MSKYEGHTPGPWAVCPRVSTRVVAFSDADFTVATAGCSQSNWRVLSWETEANARLIAAAPTLLAQRDEAVALLRRATDACDLHRMDMHGSIDKDIYAFLSRLDTDAEGGR